MSVHEDCEYYHKPDDICLCFSMLSTCAFNVSKKTKKCLGEVLYNDED